jgi:hypothetical protein
MLSFGLSSWPGALFLSLSSFSFLSFFGLCGAIGGGRSVAGRFFAGALRGSPQALPAAPPAPGVAPEPLKPAKSRLNVGLCARL